MQGIRTGVVTRIQTETSAALPVHYLAQDAGKQMQILRDALDIVKEISQLIKPMYSKKNSGVKKGEAKLLNDLKVCEAKKKRYTKKAA